MGLRAEVFLTERGGHARELATGALDRGATVVVAWGGDGTVNEVAGALAFRDADLGVIPSGSGNGLARELGIPADPSAALAVALSGRSRVIDCGELDGRLFVNVAGIGFDALVAREFASHRQGQRGFVRYARITAREMFRYEPAEHTIVADHQVLRKIALLVAIANARQYGNGAVIARSSRRRETRRGSRGGPPRLANTDAGPQAVHREHRQGAGRGDAGGLTNSDLVGPRCSLPRGW
jgi:diacylglycerol kinase family enzyme